MDSSRLKGYDVVVVVRVCGVRQDWNVITVRVYNGTVVRSERIVARGVNIQEAKAESLLNRRAVACAIQPCSVRVGTRVDLPKKS